MRFVSVPDARVKEFALRLVDEDVVASTIVERVVDPESKVAYVLLAYAFIAYDVLAYVVLA